MTMQRLNLSYEDRVLEDSTVAEADAVKADAQPDVTVTRVFVCSATPGIAEMVAKSLAHDETVSSRSQQISLAALVADHNFDMAQFDVIMFEVSPSDDTESAALRQLCDRGAGRVKFLGVTAETLSLAQAKHLMDIGVDEVMPLRIGRPDMADAQDLAAASEKAITRRDGDIHNGLIVAISQSRGGIGATSFALNLATALTEGSRKDKSEPARVAVVDLDFQNGVLGANIDIEDNGAFIEFLKAQELADFAFISGALQSYRDRFDVLPAPTELAPLDAMTPELMASLLDELRLSYDVVLLDLPRAITHWHNAVLARADQLYILTDLAVHSVRQARRLKDAFSDDHVSLPVEVLVSLQKKPFILNEAAREAEKFLDQKLEHWIAPDPASARRAADAGEPLALSHRRSVTSKSITPIVDGLRVLATSEARRMA